MNLYKKILNKNFFFKFISIILFIVSIIFLPGLTKPNIFNNKNILYINNKYENKLNNSLKIYNNKILLKNKNKLSFGLNVALCVIAKQENIYINEFVDYYFKLGIKKIFLYDNNELNDENFYEVLEKEIKNGFIQVINFRGINKPQRKAYDDCYNNNKNDFDWIGFYDVDEFLYIENYTNINEFLSLPIFDNCTSILVNWKYYGDNNYIYYEPKPLKERFTKPFYFTHKIESNKYLFAAAKSIIRGGLNITWAHFPHFLENSTICRPTGTIVERPLLYPNYSSAYIKHYATKSTQEYIIKLFKGTVNSNITINRDSIIFWLKNYYFIINKITRKKILFLKRILKFKIEKYLV